MYQNIGLLFLTLRAWNSVIADILTSLSQLVLILSIR